MNLRTTLLSLALVSPALAGTSQAQLAAYGTVTVEHVTGIHCLQTQCGNSSGVVNPLGGFGGVYYDFRTIGPVRLGFDVRAGSTIGNKNAATYFNSARPRVFSALGGVRASFHVPLAPLRPYVEGAIGYAKSNLAVPEDPATGQVNYQSGIAYRGFAGLDLSILPVLDFRVVELGAGGLHNLGNNYPVYSVSTGIVLHLPSLR